MSRWVVLAATAAVAALTLTACGGGGDGSSTVAAAQSAAAKVSQAEASGTAAAADTTATDGSAGDGSGSAGSPCDLVSTQQLASILHHDVTDASVVAGVCFFTNGNADEAYQLATFDDANCWARATGVSNTPVAGVGDAAVGSGLGLEVKHGSTCISLGGGTAAEQSGDFSTDVAVAKIVLGKLG